MSSPHSSDFLPFNQQVLDSVLRLDKLSGGILFGQLFESLELAYEEVLKNFESWRANEKWEEIREKVHSLNGKASTLGASNIRQTCIFAEDCVEASDYEGLGVFLDRLKLSWERDVPSIREKASQSNTLLSVGL